MPDSIAHMQTLDIRKHDYLTDAHIYFRALSILDHPIWLDSGKPNSQHGRFDILTALPNRIFTNPNADTVQQAVNELFKDIDLSTIKKYEAPFIGGAIGYFNYEYNHSALNIKTHRSDNSASKKNNRSQSLTGIFDWCLIQDHELKKTYSIFLPRCDDHKKSNILNIISTVSHNNSTFTKNNEPFSVTKLQPSISKSTYINAIKKIKHYIINGDTYQINFAHRFVGTFKGSTTTAYLALRQKMPGPFSAYMDLSSEKILSFSPERFIQVNNMQALTQPIKGTARRSELTKEDKQLAKTLITSEKNRSENLMIVDLLRNDFNKLCEPLSVKTPHLFALESFSNVHHLVSSVIGTLKHNIKPIEFLLSCFPGGSITGAPKKRAMEIIDELETFPRNMYCGSIYYLTANEKMDSNITIRTVTINNNECICWGGGGIVADSTPEEEYEESLQKIQILLDTLLKQ